MSAIKPSENSISIERGIMNRCKDERLSWLKDIHLDLYPHRLVTYSEMGMPSVELVRKGEMRQIAEDNGFINYFELIKQSIDSLNRLRYENPKSSEYLIGVEIEPVQVFEPVYEKKWIGAPLGPKYQDLLNNERQNVSKVLREYLNPDIDLNPMIFFVNLAVVTKLPAKTGELDTALEIINNRMPQTVDLYNVATRVGKIKS